MKLPNFTRPLYKLGENNTIFFLFLNLNTVFSDLIAEILADI